jgi:hypothetical protein
MFDLLIYNILSIRKMNRSLVGLDLELSSICCNFTAIYILLNFICMCASNYLDFGVYEPLMQFFRYFS